MNERTPSPVEKIPTEGEVLRVIERLSNGAECTEIKRVEDDLGLSRLTLELVDSEGDRMLYDYQRAVEAVDANFAAAIDVIFHNSEGIPCGGCNVANYDNDGWKIVG